MTRSRAAPVLVAALASLFLVVTVAVPLTPRLQRDDWRSVAAALGERSSERVIVVNPLVGFVPLASYEPEVAAPPGPRPRVRELAVIVMTRDGREPLTTPPVPGFIVRSTDRDPSYVLTRFVSDVPREVDVAALTRLPLTPDPTGLVYEPAPSP
jgi:hypothetical protein